MGRYFVVFQNKTFKEEISRGFLWAPILGKDKKRKFYWDTMQQIQKGDIIFSIVNNRIYAIGVAASCSYLSDNLFPHELWNKDGYRCDVNYQRTSKHYKLMDHINEYRHLLPEKYSPIIHKTGKGNVGYLYQISDVLGTYFLSMMNVEVNHINPMNKIGEVKELHTNIDEIEFEEMIPTTKEDKVKKKRKFNKKVDVDEEAKKMIQNKITGNQGEKLVFDFLAKRQNEIDDLFENALIEYATSDGDGYDILCVEPESLRDGYPSTEVHKRYIEVKTTKENWDEPFYLSKHELEFAEKNRENYFIFRVYHLGKQPGIKIIKFKDLPSELIVPINYQVTL